MAFQKAPERDAYLMEGKTRFQVKNLSPQEMTVDRIPRNISGS